MTHFRFRPETYPSHPLVRTTPQMMNVINTHSLDDFFKYRFKSSCFSYEYLVSLVR